MKSLVKKNKNENLIFHWDPYSNKNKIEIDKTFNKDLNNYFEFLETIKPHKNELNQITIFKRSFSLNEEAD